MTKLKSVAVGLLLIAVVIGGLALAANRFAGRPQGKGNRAQPPQATKSKAQPPPKLMSEYVVEPHDVLRVEVLEALPERPIEGERVVRPTVQSRSSLTETFMSPV